MAVSGELPSLRTVKVLGKDSICIGRGLVRQSIFKDLLTNLPSSTYALVTDTNLSSLYLAALEEAFDAQVNALGGLRDTRLIVYTIPPGESSKSRETKCAIENWLLDHQCTKDTVLLALGGGVVGDLAGFVAATYMRGIRFVQIPTTLLAMADSSIGGKTAIDTPHGKNLIGAIWQPERIYMDLKFLETLPRRELLNGMAEIIKTLAISDEAMFCHLERNSSMLMRAFTRTLDDRTSFDCASPILEEIVLASAQVKARIVSMDEKEDGLRNLLNFGHTIGHAIETLLTPAVLHGECVAIGMVKEAELARHLGILSPTSVARLSSCIARYGLPISLHDKTIRRLSKSKSCPVDALMSSMVLDKKNSGNTKKVVLLSSIGSTFEQKASAVSDADIRVILSEAIEIGPRVQAVNARPVICEPPGSKSISNRALLLAALGSGSCKITNLLHSDDTQVMLTALETIGAASFTWRDEGRALEVTGHGGKLTAPSTEIYLGNAGTASRFLTTAVSLAHPTLLSTHTVLTGNTRMQQRPQEPLVDALRCNGIEIEYLGQHGSLPLRIAASGGLSGGTINLAASVSSQYVSSILMCAPLAKEPVRLHLIGEKVISQPYIDMTIAMMKDFGVNVMRLDTNTYHIPRQRYSNPPFYTVESDASSATYPLAMAAISSSACTVPSIGSKSLQGDAGFAVEVLRPMGCTVEQTEYSTTVIGPELGRLLPLPHIDMEPMTDAFLTTCILAAVASPDKTAGRTSIVGIANQRVKECNRIQAMRHELAKFGVECVETEDGIDIWSRGLGSLQAPRANIDCYDDHRVAMSLSVLACVAPGPTTILERECVGKTWPGWWDVLRNVFDVGLLGKDRPADHLIMPPPKASQLHSRMSIILIGMRGVGKSTAGQRAADLLGYDFVDMDCELESVLQSSIPDIIREHGWPYFRIQEGQLLQKLLATRPENCVIATGGGIVEAIENRRLLTAYGKAGGQVVLLTRNMQDVISYLEMDKSRPAYVEHMMEVWQRRQPLYEECSNIQYCLPTLHKSLEGSGIDDFQADFVRFLGSHTPPTKPVQEDITVDIAAKRFYIFGKPIAESKSPPMHNALFAEARLPHTYTRLETDNVVDLVCTIRAPDFGGASITMPLKLDIMQHLDAIDEAAGTIGAVNTIVPQSDPDTKSTTLLGYNTDWQGIIHSLQRAGASNGSQSRSAVVVGGGGTARAAIYALHKMEYKPIFLVGRNREKLAALASEFGSEYRLSVLAELDEALAVSPDTLPTIAISTIPANSCVDGEFADVLSSLLIHAGTQKRDSMMTGITPCTQRLFLEMAYGSGSTSMTRFLSDSDWTVIPGTDVLVAQGLYQSMLWTGKIPSFEVAANAISSCEQM